jgi:hypothetical protein
MAFLATTDGQPAFAEAPRTPARAGRNVGSMAQVAPISFNR